MAQPSPSSYDPCFLIIILVFIIYLVMVIWAVYFSGRHMQYDISEVFCGYVLTYKLHAL
jgi:hypothetical protein